MKSGKRFGPEIREWSVQMVFGEDTLASQQRTKDNHAQSAQVNVFTSTTFLVFIGSQHTLVTV